MSLLTTYKIPLLFLIIHIILRLLTVIDKNINLINFTKQVYCKPEKHHFY